VNSLPANSSPTTNMTGPMMANVVMMANGISTSPMFNTTVMATMSPSANQVAVAATPGEVPIHTFTSMPMHSNFQPMHLTSNSEMSVPFGAYMQMNPGNVMPQISDVDMPKLLSVFENAWSLQNIPTEQPQLFLPSLSNLGAFSNCSLGSQSPKVIKQIDTKSIVGNTFSTNPNELPLLTQLSNGQVGTSTILSGQ